MSGSSRHCSDRSWGYVLVKAVWVTGERNPLEREPSNKNDISTNCAAGIRQSYPLLGSCYGPGIVWSPLNVLFNFILRVALWGKYIWQLRSINEWVTAVGNWGSTPSPLAGASVTNCRIYIRVVALKWHESGLCFTSFCPWLVEDWS